LFIGLRQSLELTFFVMISIACVHNIFFCGISNWWSNHLLGKWVSDRLYKIDYAKIIEWKLNKNYGWNNISSVDKSAEPVFLKLYYFGKYQLVIHLYGESLQNTTKINKKKHNIINIIEKKIVTLAL
jgi:hypothetical protein